MNTDQPTSKRGRPDVYYSRAEKHDVFLTLGAIGGCSILIGGALIVKAFKSR